MLCLKELDLETELENFLPVMLIKERLTLCNWESQVIKRKNYHFHLAVMHVNYENIWHPNAELPSKSLLKKKKWEREIKLKYGNRGSSQLQNILIKLIKQKIAVPPQFKKKKKKSYSFDLQCSLWKWNHLLLKCLQNPYKYTRNIFVSNLCSIWQWKESCFFNRILKTI